MGPLFGVFLFWRCTRSLCQSAQRAQLLSQLLSLGSATMTNAFADGTAGCEPTGFV